MTHLTPNRSCDQNTMHQQLQRIYKGSTKHLSISHLTPEETLTITSSTIV